MPPRSQRKVTLKIGEQAGKEQADKEQQDKEELLTRNETLKLSSEDMSKNDMENQKEETPENSPKSENVKFTKDRPNKKERKEFLASSPLDDIPGTLSLRCRKLRDKDTLYADDKSDAKVIVYQRLSIAAKWKKVGETEVVQDNLNPEFKKSFSFKMEASLELRFECYDEDETRNGPKFEMIGVTVVPINKLVEKINTEVPFVLKIDKTNRSNGELLLTLKTTEDLNSLEERARLLAEEGYDIKKDTLMKKRVAEKVNQYVEDSFLHMAFKLIFAEILSKKIPAEEVYIYGAKRLREIGEHVNSVVSHLS